MRKVSCYVKENGRNLESARVQLVNKPLYVGPSMFLGKTCCFQESFDHSRRKCGKLKNICVFPHNTMPLALIKTNSITPEHILYAHTVYCKEYELTIIIYSN